MKFCQTERLICFDRCLVRRNWDDMWRPAFYAGRAVQKDGSCLVYVVGDREAYSECVPWDGNECVVWTSLVPPTAEEFKRGDVVEVRADDDDCRWRLRRFVKYDRDGFVCIDEGGGTACWKQCRKPI